MAWTLANSLPAPSPHFQGPISTPILLSIRFCSITLAETLGILAMCGIRPRSRQLRILSRRNLVDDTDPSWMLKTSMTAKKHCNHVRKALAHQQDLQSVLTAIAAKRNQGDVAESSIFDAVQEAQRELDGLHDFFSMFLNPIFYNERPCKSDGGSAHTVFAVAELLEMILAYVAIRDILNFQQTNHAAYDAIDSSPRLQRMMSLREEPQNHLRTPFGAYSHGVKGGFFCKYDSPSMISTGERQVPLTAGFSMRGLSHTIGTRWMRMFICQPPVHEMRVETVCCGNRGGQSEGQVIRSNTGLTIGDLYGASKMLIEEHRTCVHANATHHDQHGFVQAEPVFSTMVKLDEHDPIARKYDSPASVQPAHSSSVATYYTGVARLEAYTNYKRRGTSSVARKRP